MAIHQKPPYIRPVTTSNILLTGAAGRLGRIVLPALRAAGHTVTGIDVVAGEGDVGVIDLLDESATSAFIADVRPETVIHLANHPGPNRGSAQKVLRENVAMNMHVFEAAVEQGAQRLIFASSMQVYQGELDTLEAIDRNLPGLPLGAAVAPSPRNPYGLSKVLGERTVAYFCESAGVSGVSLRFPGLWVARSGPPQFDPERFRERAPQPESMQWLWATVALPAEQAAQLLDCLVRAELEGHRCYVPSIRRMPGLVPSDFLEEWMPRVADRFRERLGDDGWSALRERLNRDGMADLAALEKDAGWVPQD